MTWDDALAAWVLHLRAERRLGVHTVSAYRSDMAAFLKRVRAPYPSPGSLDSTGVILGLGDGMNPPEGRARGLSKPGRSPVPPVLSRRTHQRRQSSLKSFLQFMVDENILPSAILGTLEPMRSERPLPDHLTESEWQKVMAPFESAADPRGRLLFGLMGGMGLRVSEVVGLKAGDYSKSESILRVKGKGDKTRFIPLPPWLLPLLEDALPPLQGHGPQWLFPGSKGLALSRQQVWNLVKRHGLQSGVSRPLHPHMLRHGFATRFLASGASLRVVQEFLGHADVRTTEQYTHLSSDRLRKTVDQHHPFSR